jgi:predicted N-acetyltransferase YhbS
MPHRSGEHIADRLAMCSLYNPAADLAIKADDSTVATYLLYWFDPVTRVGLVEPMHVGNAFQRQSLARAMVMEGVRRLVEHGAKRVKVSYENKAAQKIYEGIGFVTTHSTTWFVRETT